MLLFKTTNENTVCWNDTNISRNGRTRTRRNASLIRNYRLFLWSSGWTVYNDLPVFYFHPINKHHSFRTRGDRSAMINAKHFLAIRRINYAIMPRTRDYATFMSVFVQNWIAFCLFKRAQRRIGCRITHGVVLASEMIGGIHDIVDAVLFKCY